MCELKRCNSFEFTKILQEISLKISSAEVFPDATQLPHRNWWTIRIFPTVIWFSLRSIHFWRRTRFAMFPKRWGLWITMLAAIRISDGRFTGVGPEIHCTAGYAQRINNTLVNYCKSVVQTTADSATVLVLSSCFKMAGLYVRTCMFTCIHACSSCVYMMKKK